MALKFEDKLDLSKMTVYDGAQIQANVFSTIAEYQVTTADKVRFWGYTEEVSPTQVLMGSIKVVLKDSTPTEINDNAIVRLVVMNNSKNKTYEVARFKYADIKSTAKDLPVRVPGAYPFSYLAVEVALPDGASAFTFSESDSSLDISTTVIQD